MNFSDAISSGFKKYATFSGRASRSEYWFWVLFSFLVIFAGAVIDSAAGTGYAFYAIAVLALFLPSLSVLIRRLHDLNRSGGWYWIALIPLVGAIMLLVWMCTEGTRGDNSYGSNPLGN